MNRVAAVLGAVVLVFLVVPSTADSKPKVAFHEFTVLEVQNFENPKYETKEPMPDGWLPIIREDIVQRVIELHKFHHVMDFHDTNVADPAKERVLVLRGKVVEFTQGSQAARLIVGFGAGKGKIVTMCEFVDKETGEVIWQRKADGRVIGAGQPTEGAIKGLSKEIAKHINENW